MTSQASTPFEAGTFTRIYDPSVGETEQWYINDHCFALGPDGVWHMFGITHAEPLNPMDEKCLAHACSASLAQTPWRKLPFALTADREHWDEFHLWAPFIVRHEGAYYMYVCVGDEDHRTYKIHLAVSEDLYSWTRHPTNPMVVDGFDARDPCVLRVRDRWIMYYTATSRRESRLARVFFGCDINRKSKIQNPKFEMTLKGPVYETALPRGDLPHVLVSLRGVNARSVLRPSRA
jgi:beta-fructofuranosidase